VIARTAFGRVFCFTRFLKIITGKTEKSKTGICDLNFNAWKRIIIEQGSFLA